MNIILGLEKQIQSQCAVTQVTWAVQAPETHDNRTHFCPLHLRVQGCCTSALRNMCSIVMMWGVESQVVW